MGGNMRNGQKLIQRLTWLVVIVLLLAPGLAYAEGSEIYLPMIWCIDEESWPIAQGYTHFHWIREGGGAGEGEHSGLQVGEEYTGYLIKLTARTTFVFQHAGEHDQGGEPGGPPTDPEGDHDDGSCGDDSGHEEGGCGGDDGGHEEEGGCSGDDGHEDDGSNCAHKGVLVSPGIDFVSHANVTTCQ